MGLARSFLQTSKPDSRGIITSSSSRSGSNSVDDLQRFLAVGGGADLAIEIAEVGFEQLDVLKVVVGDQDFGGATD